MAGSSPPADGELRGSAIALAVAAALVSVVWLTEIAGDPTDGVVFFTFGFAAPTLVGIALLIAASRRRDIFGKLGLAGAIVVLVGTLTIDVIGFVAALIGLLLVAVAVARNEPRLLAGLGLLALGALGLAVGIGWSDTAYVVFLPVVAGGSAVLAVMLYRISAEA